MTAIWIRNGLVGSKDGFHRSDVVVNGERFEATGAVRPFGPWRDIDATGLWLVPGDDDAGLLLLLDDVSRGVLEPGQLVLQRGQEILPGLAANLVAVDPGATTRLGTREVHGAIRWMMQRGIVVRGDSGESGI